MSKNITSKNGGVIKVGDPVKLTTKTREGEISRNGIAVAVNAETDKDNVRIVFDDSLHIQPKASASDLEILLPGSASANEETGLRTDGPTLSEYVAAGLPAENYPPKGYTDKRTDEEIAAAIRAQAEKQKSTGLTSLAEDAKILMDATKDVASGTAAG